MKILILHNFYQHKGGEDRYVLSLYRLLTEKKQTVVLYSKKSDQIESTVISKIITATHLFQNKIVKNELSKILIEQKPDIVHVHNVYPLLSPVVYRICRKFSIPVVQTIHNYRDICAGGFMIHNGLPCMHTEKNLSAIRKMISNCYRNSYLQTFVFSLAYFFHKRIGSFENISSYIFTSDFAREYYNRYVSLDKKKQFVLPYFIFPPHKSNSTRDKPKNYFLFVGRISQEKGIVQLLEVFSKLPKYNLIVIGRGPLQSRVDAYKRFHNITFYSEMENEKTMQFMRNARSVIIPSRWYETGPLVMIESFANGTAVIVPDMGGFRFVKQDNKLGAVFSKNCARDVIKTIEKVGQQVSIHKNAQYRIDYYKNHFSPEDHYKNLMRIYSETVRSYEISK